MIAIPGASQTVIITADLAWLGAIEADREVEVVLTTDSVEFFEHQARAILRILYPNRVATTLKIERL